MIASCASCTLPKQAVHACYCTEDAAQDTWALPGGFVDENEPLQHAAERELKEETALDAKDLLLIQVGSCWTTLHACSFSSRPVTDRPAAVVQTGAYGDPGRDPRGWAVSVAFAAVVPSTDVATQAGVSKGAQWSAASCAAELTMPHCRMMPAKHSGFRWTR